MEELEIHPEDLEPSGMVCASCDAPFEIGEKYSTSLIGFYDDAPITLIVCIPCGMGMAPVD